MFYFKLSKTQLVYPISDILNINEYEENAQQ